MLFHSFSWPKSSISKFARECEIKTALERHVQKQFELATRKGRYNRDEFETNDAVRIKNMNTGKWDICGVISEVKSEVSADGSKRAYTVLAENGTLYQRNATHIHHWVL